MVELLHAYYTKARRVLDRRMATGGASFSRWRILVLIDGPNPVRSIDLAAALGISPRSVTEAVDGLARDGLVRRDPDEVDRRAKRILITPAGQRAIEVAEAARTRLVGEMFDGLTDAEATELARLLGKLTALVDSIAS